LVGYFWNTLHKEKIRNKTNQWRRESTTNGMEESLNTSTRMCQKILKDDIKKRKYTIKTNMAEKKRKEKDICNSHYNIEIF
jgi:hypothetical protein